MGEPSLFWTSLPLIPFKLRNSLLDCLFYDVGSLTTAELSYLLWLDAQKGSVIVVPPTGKGHIHYYPKAARFIIRKLPEVSTVVLAGVGSSVVGAAALARNVADALGEEVAAVISGYGVADVLGEALGGWFFFGNADRFRREVDRIMYWVQHPGSSRPAPRGEVVLPTSIFDPSSSGYGLPGDEDAVTLSNIFLAQPAKLRLLVGHSKGSLIIDAALEEYREALGPDDDFVKQLKIVTLSAVSNIPAFVHKRALWQFIGGMDWFGGLNSDLDVDYDKVGNSWHHLNRALPFHLNAIQVVRDAINAAQRPAHLISQP